MSTLSTVTQGIHHHHHHQQRRQKNKRNYEPRAPPLQVPLKPYPRIVKKRKAYKSRPATSESPPVTAAAAAAATATAASGSATASMSDPSHQHIVSHYDAQTRRSCTHPRQKQHYQQKRRNSAIGPLRFLNNFMKSVLFDSCIPERKDGEQGCIGWDACSGRGGDIRKWMREQASQVTFVDASPVATEEAKRRYGQLTTQVAADFQGTFLVANMFEAPVAQMPEFQAMIQRCDAVSCQFALHYAFQSESHLRRLLFHVSQLLKPEGVFFGITTDATKIQAFYHKHKGSKENEARTSVCTIKPFNHFHSTRTDNTTQEVMEQKEASVFGRAYEFTLQGGESVDHCKEYLVDLPALKDWATSYGLRFESSKGLREYYQEVEKPLTRLRFLMQVPEIKDVPQEQLEVFDLYRTFVFRRTREQNIVY